MRYLHIIIWIKLLKDSPQFASDYNCVSMEINVNLARVLVQMNTPLFSVLAVIEVLKHEMWYTYNIIKLKNGEGCFNKETK